MIDSCVALPDASCLPGCWLGSLLLAVAFAAAVAILWKASFVALASPNTLLNHGSRAAASPRVQYPIFHSVDSTCYVCPKIVDQVVLLHFSGGLLWTLLSLCQQYHLGGSHIASKKNPQKKQTILICIVRELTSHLVTKYILLQYCSKDFFFNFVCFITTKVAHFLHYN